MSDRYECPLCGKGALTATPYMGSHTVTCWNCREVMEPGDFLRAVAVEVGAPGGGDIKLDPARWLEPAPDNGKVNERGGRCGVWDKGIDLAYFQGCASRLFGPEPMAREAMEWLTRERGIARRTLRRSLVGWNGMGVTLPTVYSTPRGKQVFAAKLRYPDNEHRTLPGWTGCKWVLYGIEEAESDWLVLCEGELDALRAQSLGIPAVSVPLGCGTWKDTWTTMLDGFEVWVTFDVGAVVHARRRVQELRAAGIPTRHTPLPRRWRGYDLTDYLRDHSRADLERRLGWR